MSQTFETQFGGRTLTIETGKLARLAGGAVTVRYGDTMVLGTANRSEPRPGLDFFPLTVDFEERMYAAGKIPGGFIKREARAVGGRDPRRPPDRPADPAALPRGLQGRHPARHHGPLDRPGERPRRPRHDRRVGRADDQRDPVQRPRRRRPRSAGSTASSSSTRPTAQLEESELDLIVSGTRDAIMMVEAGAKLLPEDVMAEAILFGHRALQPLIDLQEQLREAVGKPKRIAVPRARHRLGPRLRRRPSTPSASSSSSTSRRPAPTRRWPISSRSRAVKVKGGKITDRWSTFVKPAQPIVGNQMHGITDKDVAKAPSPADAAEAGRRLHRRRARRRPQRRLRPRLPRGGRRRRRPLRRRAATSTR